MKLCKKKLVAAAIAALCVLGVADLTVLENSKLKEVLHKVEAVLGADEEADADAPLIDAPKEEAAPAE